MNRIIIVLLALFIATSAGAQTVSTAGPGNPLPVADTPFSQFVIPATQTLLVTDVAQLIPTDAPAGAHTLYICASGAINVGNASVAAGLNGGIQISSGGYLRLPLDMSTRSHKIYLINYATSTATPYARFHYAK